MVESTQTSEQADQSTHQASEVSEVIEQLEQYRNRLVEEFMTAAKKAKLPKSLATAQLEQHPEIVKIDASLAQLREQHGF
jgi:phage shock protein A